MPEYLTSTKIAGILGCSKDAARAIMERLPRFRPGGPHKRCAIYVRREDFEAYIAENTVQPGTPQPRVTPFETEKQQQDRELKEWHRQRREAQKKGVTL